MKQKFLQKYLSIVVLLATLMGSTHHHNDLQQHHDCQICTISSLVADVDTPSEITYITELSILHEATLSKLPNFLSAHALLLNNSRAPPKLS